MKLPKRWWGGPMLILACLALGVAACHDDVLAPNRNAPGDPVARAVSGPVEVARYTCVLSRASAEVHCSTSAAPTAPGVSPSVILPPSGPYAQLYPYNMVKDTVAQTWTFAAVVKNLLAQPMGTLDGTAIAGTKVALTAGPTVTGGTGTVTVANADGTGTFTGPDQPYWFYNEITAPQAFTAEKLWRFNVPNTVTAISISIVISTDFPAEQDVALVPPDSQPAWAHADTAYKDEWLKRVVAVVFKRGTSSADRQLAVASVGGTVVGGSSLAGMYLLVVPDDGGFVQVDTAVARLNRLPQVGAASRMGRVRGLHLKPHDGAGWQSWTLQPDSVGSEENWPLEEINAPMAWGCSTGDTTARIAVVDHPFDQTEAIANAGGPLPTLNGFSNETTRHGTWVTGVLAARGNDSSGITGAMWHAKMRLYDWGTPTPNLLDVVNAIITAARDSMTVLNLSYGRSWTLTNASWHPNWNDSSTVVATYQAEKLALDSVYNAGTMPLVVISAGDEPFDAFWTEVAGIRDFYSDRVIVAGGSQKAPLARWVSSNTGHLIDVFAPAADIHTTGPSGTVTVEGTSFSAPYVAGVAGLLKSFDPSLTVPELKQLIIDGSVLGNRMIAKAPSSADRAPLLNAYEALKLAAGRSGAPLCGNRVWVAGSYGATMNVVVQRASSTTETIWSDPAYPNSMMVRHGGRRIYFVNDTGDAGIAYDAATRKWHADKDATKPPPEPDAGASNSAWGLSHDADSSLVVSRSTDQATVPISLHDSHSGRTALLVTLPTGIINSVDSACVLRNYTSHVCLKKEWIGYTQSARIHAAYSPMGDSAVVAISRVEQDAFVATDWKLISDPATDTVPASWEEARSTAATQSTVDARLYSIPIGGASAAPASFETIAGTEIHQLGISADGRELLLARGEFQNAPGIGVPQYSNCGFTFYTRATRTFSTLLPSDMACNWVSTVTASPLRMAGGLRH